MTSPSHINHNLTPADGDEDAPTPAAGRRFSLNLVHQARRGKFSTRRPVAGSAQATEVTEQSGGITGPVNSEIGRGVDPTSFQLEPDAADSPAGEAIEGTALHTAAPSIIYRRNASAAESGQAQGEGAHYEALEKDRLTPQGGILTVLSKAKELRITAAAAKSLTKLFAALSLEPGSGPEVPSGIREQVLSLLVRESHQLADNLSRAVVGNDQTVPVYLRAKLLQAAADFLSEQWSRTGQVRTEAIEALSREAFAGKVGHLTQVVADLFHVAGEYTPASTEELSQVRVTESAIRMSWACLRQVEQFDLRDYDSDRTQEKDIFPFSYGKEAALVAKDLTQAALEIVRENDVDLADLDQHTTWLQNAIERASLLVRSEYRMLTDRALRSAFKDDLFSEAALNKTAGLYDTILDRVKTRARNGFIQVERNAIEAMAATAFRHYLPRKRLDADHGAEGRSTTSAEASSLSIDGLAVPASPTAPTSQGGAGNPLSKRFRFGAGSPATTTAAQPTAASTSTQTNMSATTDETQSKDTEHASTADRSTRFSFNGSRAA